MRRGSVPGIQRVSLGSAAQSDAANWSEGGAKGQRGNQRQEEAPLRLCSTPRGVVQVAVAYLSHPNSELQQPLHHCGQGLERRRFSELSIRYMYSVAP